MQASLRSLARSVVSRPTLSQSARLPLRLGAVRYAHFLNASEKEFNERVRNGGDKIVLVDFYADWCGPCRTLSPLLEAISEDGSTVIPGAPAVDLVSVDTDKEFDLAREFGISSLPTVIAFKNGEQIGNFVGARPMPFVEAFLKKLDD
ncbi:thioredoxin-like protein [Clavulina sp. PMI_390]|nr:thioredoxin-like protein [Clavulina sp. PMI_390]